MKDFALVRSNEQVYGFIYNNTELLSKTFEVDERFLFEKDNLNAESKTNLLTDAAYKNDIEYLNSIVQL